MISSKKSLGQNFLIDKNIREKILSKIKIKNQVILEIGPGKGFLTESIIDKKPKKIILIEKDINLYNALILKYENHENITLYNTDILDFNISTLKKINIISNLPYNISVKVLLNIYKNNKNINECILMIQKEVADKFNYKKQKINKYKFLTEVFCNYEKCFDVPSTVFKPQPKVKSSVIKINLLKSKIDYEKILNFSNLIFNKKRKKLSNVLNLNLTKEKLMDKRVEELKFKELLFLYQSF